MPANEWIPVTQAAQEFGRSRQAIDLLIKNHALECRQIGPRALKHVNREALEIHYSKQLSRFTPKRHSKDNQLSEVSSISHLKSLQSQLAHTREILVAREKYIEELESKISKLEQNLNSKCEHSRQGAVTETRTNIFRKVRKIGIAIRDFLPEKE